MRGLAVLVTLTSLSLSASHAFAQVQLGLGVGGSYGGYSLSHDSSGVSASLGSPTSILQYSDLLGPSVELSVGSSMWDPAFFAVSGRYTQILSGTLRDTDYALGQVVTSDTFSTIEGHQSFAEIKFSPELLPRWETDVGTFRLYGTATAGSAQIDALGLTCGIRCSAPTVADDLAVIQQSHLSFDAGVGLAWARQYSEGSQLEITGSMAIGRTHVDDSHNLRSDLGPTPNVIYRFTTVRPSLSAQFTQQLTPALNFKARAAVNYTNGHGTLTLGPKAKTTYIDLPAQFQSFSSTLTLGLAGQF